MRPTLQVLLLFGSIIFVLPLVYFLAASCEPSKEPANPTTECSADSLKRPVIDPEYGAILLEVQLTDSIGMIAFKQYGKWTVNYPVRLAEFCIKSTINNVKTRTKLLDSIRAWKNVVAINHVNLERLNMTAQDLTLEIEARDEQIAKYRNRLDSAAAIIKRQNEQLANSIYNKQK